MSEFARNWTHTIYPNLDRRPAGKWTNGLVRRRFGLFDLLLLWQSRAAERHALREMDDRMLKDVRLTHTQVDQESRKPFWRA